MQVPSAGGDVPSDSDKMPIWMSLTNSPTKSPLAISEKTGAIRENKHLQKTSIEMTSNQLRIFSGQLTHHPSAQPLLFWFRPGRAHRRLVCFSAAPCPVPLVSVSLEASRLNLVALRGKWLSFKFNTFWFGLSLIKSYMELAPSRFQNVV